MLPPWPLTLWHWMHCSVWKSCSPRPRVARNRIGRRKRRHRRQQHREDRWSHLDHPEPGHEDVRPEALKQVELLPVTIILPLGVPVYVSCGAEWSAAPAAGSSAMGRLPVEMNSDPPTVSLAPRAGQREFDGRRWRVCALSR